VAKLCRSEWLVARFRIPDRRTACVTARDTAASCAWCRRTSAVRGSFDIFADGNTYCQTKFTAAFGSLRDKTSGRYTRPNPAARSFSCNSRTRSRCADRSARTAAGQHRPPVLVPLPLANDDLLAAEVDVLDPQPEELEQAQPAPVQPTPAIPGWRKVSEWSGAFAAVGVLNGERGPGLGTRLGAARLDRDGRRRANQPGAASNRS
jgi:hypothetical protein